MTTSEGVFFAPEMSTSSQVRVDEVIAGSNEEIDRVFYSIAHNTNIRYMLEWLVNK